MERQKRSLEKNSGRRTLRRSEILRGTVWFQQLLREGGTIRVGNLQCHYKTYLVSETEFRSGVYTSFSVPRRHVRKAVDRNRLKRIMREAFRMHKQIIWEASKDRAVRLHVLFVYRGNPDIKPRYVKLSHVQTDMIRCLENLSERITEGKET